MYLRRFNIIILIIFIISLISGISLFLSDNKIPLNLVTESVYAEDGSIYFLEQSEDNCNIYHTDSEGRLIEKICSDKINDGYYCYLFKLKYFNGKLYVALYKNDVINTDDYSNDLFECNFEKGRLDKITDFGEKLDVDFDYVIDNNCTYLLYTEPYEFSLKLDYINEKFSENHSYDVGGDVYYDKLIIDKDKNAYTVNSDSQLLYLAENGYNEICSADEISGKQAEISYDGNNKIYFIDCEDNMLKYYDINEGICSIADTSFAYKIDEYNSANNTAYTWGEMKNINFTDDGNFVCSVDNYNGGYSLGICNENGFYVIDEIDRDYGVILSELIIIGYTLLVFIALSLIAFLIYLFVFRYVSLIIRTIISFSAIAGISVAIIFNSMSVYLNESFNNFINDKMLYMCENRLKYFSEYSDEEIKELAGTDINLIDYNELTDIQCSLYDVIGYYANEGVLNVEDSLNAENEINIGYGYLYYWCMIDENDNVKMVYSNCYNSDMPIEYVKSRYIADTIRKVIETGEKQIIANDLYNMQECPSVYAPVYSSDGKISAVIGVSMLNYMESSVRVKELINKNISIVFFIIAVLIILIAVFLILFLKPLKELKNKATELMQGNMGVTVKIHGNNEITRLSEQFNLISASLAENITDMKLLKKHYEYYVPNSFLKLLGKNNVSEIISGSNENISVAVLYINVHIKNVDIESHTFVDILNEFLRKISDIADEYDGIIEYYSRGGIKILYNNKYNNAVRTAVAVSELANETDFNISVKSFVSFENCKFRIIGDEKRISITTESENDIILSEINDFYDSCNIIVTDALINKYNNFFEIFGTRFIGVKTSDKTTLKLFEVFNGDSLYLKNMKRMYKDKFEKAVKLYMMKKYRDARNIFIEIYENYPEDSLAGNYIYLCDNQLRKGGDII